MKLPPSWLPPAESRKWHNRRWWDSIGYLRARTLSNPGVAPDADRIIRMAESERQRLTEGNLGGVPSPDPTARVAALDELLREARRFRAGANSDDDWDEVLGRVDSYLEVLQADHIASVKGADASDA